MRTRSRQPSQRMSIRLSICIPTYNRAAFIGEALESVISQAGDDVEIVVSDNASTDNTEAVVREYMGRFPRLVYERLPENMGMDRNFLNAVRLASGEYCWLLGSDDAIAANAIDRILKELGDCDIYVVDIAKMGYDLRSEMGVIRVHNSPANSHFDTRKVDEIRRYISGATCNAGLFSYMSSMIFKRDRWELASICESLVGLCWVHVAKMFSILDFGADIRYLGSPLVKYRSDNDSFLASMGYVRRRLTDFKFDAVATRCLSDPRSRELVLKIIGGQFFNLATMLSDKRSSLLADGEVEYKKLLDYYGIFKNERFYYFKYFIVQSCPLALLNVMHGALGLSRSFLLFLSRCFKRLVAL